MTISLGRRAGLGPPDADGPAEVRRSLRLLWWGPASPIVGFSAAELLLSEAWPLWQVIPLALLLSAPFVAGASYGLRAIRHGRRDGWGPMIVHLLFAALAIAMPISESLAS